MRILFLMPTWAAPSERWTHRMIAALEPHVAGIATLPPQEPRWRGRIDAVPLDDGPWTLAQRWRKWRGRGTRRDEAARQNAALRRYLRQARIDAVFGHYVDFVLRFAEVWDQCDLPLLVHAHGYDMQIDERLYHKPDQPRFGAAHWQAVQRLAPRARFCVGSRHFARNFAQLNVPEDRVIIKPYGVPVPPTPPERPGRQRDLTVLYLGRLADFKGPDLAIRAFTLACERGLEARLIVAGDGDLMPVCRELRQQSRFADRIELRGAVSWEEVDPLMDAADIFLAHNCIGPVTHGAETFGVAFAEAMARALPVVTGAAGSLPELITSGEDGLLVTPGDIETQAAHLLALREPDYRRRLGRAAWRTARERFADRIERRILRGLFSLPPEDGPE